MYLTKGNSLNLDNKQVRQLHSAMTGAFRAIQAFLKMMEERDRKGLGLDDEEPITVDTQNAQGEQNTEEGTQGTSGGLDVITETDPVVKSVKEQGYDKQDGNSSKKDECSSQKEGGSNQKEEDSNQKEGDGSQHQGDCEKVQGSESEKVDPGNSDQDNNKTNGAIQREGEEMEVTEGQKDKGEEKREGDESQTSGANGDSLEDKTGKGEEVEETKDKCTGETKDGVETKQTQMEVGKGEDKSAENVAGMDTDKSTIDKNEKSPTKENNGNTVERGHGDGTEASEKEEKEDTTKAGNSKDEASEGSDDSKKDTAVEATSKDTENAQENKMTNDVKVFNLQKPAADTSGHPNETQTTGNQGTQTSSFLGFSKEQPVFSFDLAFHLVYLLLTHNVPMYIKS